MKKARSNYIEPATMYAIKVLRKYFINTWVYRLPITNWLYKKVFYLGRTKAEQEIVFKGKKLRVHTKDISIVPSLINQYFEAFEIKLFEDILRPGMTVLDIGANIGIYALIAGDKVGKKGKVYAFEPVPENIKLLGHNLRQNAAANVRIVRSAAGDKQGSVDISLVKDSLATHYIGAHPKNSIPVKVDTIDNFVKTHTLKVDCIKMDIEGYEGFALEGAKKTLANNKNLKLLTELSAKYLKRSGSDPKRVAGQLLDTFKYCYVIEEHKETITRIVDIDGLLDKNNNNFLLSHKPYKMARPKSKPRARAT